MAATKAALKKKLGANLIEITAAGEDLSLTVKPASITDTMKFLRDDKDNRFDFLSCLCGVDYPETVTVVYHLFSTKHRQKATVKADVPKNDARIASVTGLWIGADWHERETAEMFGITFEGHPDPRKLLLADDNNDHPLRKDFKLDYGDNG